MTKDDANAYQTLVEALKAILLLVTDEGGDARVEYLTSEALKDVGEKNG